MHWRDVVAFVCVVVPATVATAGTGVTIGDEDISFRPSFEMSENAGTLFSVKVDLDYPGDEHQNLRTYISTDRGASWTETFVLATGPGLSIIDLDVVAVAGYYYVAYVTEDFPQQAKIRRFLASDGSVDTDYGYMIVIDDAGVEVKEVALTSNADSGNNSRLRYLAIQDNGSLRYFWTDQEGGHGATSWTEVSTGVTDADGLLDATYAEGHTGTYLYIVYESNLTATINLLRFTPGDIVVVESGLGLADTAEVRISAFGETVAVLFTVATDEATMIEDSVWELKVRISHDGGDSWTEAALLSHLNDLEDVVSADLTLRHDQGIGVTWAEGEEAFWMRCREYSSSAFWSEPVLISDAIPVPFVDAARIEAFPGLGWAVLNNRFIDPWHRSVVFDMAPVIFFDGFESGGVSHW